MPESRAAAILSGVSMSYPRGLPGRMSLIRLPRKQVLENFSLDAPAGSCTAIHGPNGCGKTTVLKLMAGLLEPGSGSVRVFGRDPVREHSATAGRTGLSLSGERSFYWRLSAVQNLEYFGTLAGLGGRDLGRRIGEVLSLTGMTRVSKTPVESLSAGFRQRLSIARAVIADPLLLLLDEPVKSLDDESRGMVLGVVRRMCDRGAAVVVAAPSASEIAGMADRSAVIEPLEHDGCSASGEASC